jgi:hypothetical protein
MMPQPTRKPQWKLRLRAATTAAERPAERERRDDAAERRSHDADYTRRQNNMTSLG